MEVRRVWRGAWTSEVEEKKKERKGEGRGKKEESEKRERERERAKGGRERERSTHEKQLLVIPLLERSRRVGSLVKAISSFYSWECCEEGVDESWAEGEEVGFEERGEGWGGRLRGGKRKRVELAKGSDKAEEG